MNALKNRLKKHSKKINSGFAGNFHDGQSGMTLTELIVAMAVLTIVMGLVLSSLISFLKSTAETKTRAESSNEILLAGQSIDSYMRYGQSLYQTPSADDPYVKCDGTGGVCQTVYIYVKPGTSDRSSIISSEPAQCVRLQVIDSSNDSKEEERKRGTRLEISTAEPVESGSPIWSNAKVYLTNLLNGDREPVLKTYNGQNLQFAPKTGKKVFGKDVVSDTNVSYTLRNYSSDKKVEKCFSPL